MNSFDNVLLCRNIFRTSCYGTEQNKTREQQHSRYLLWWIQTDQHAQHGRFHLVQIQWNCASNMPRKWVNKWKYLPWRMHNVATESYVSRQQINISQFKMCSVTQLLAFQCISVLKQQYWQVPDQQLSLPSVLQHKSEWRMIMQKSYNQQFSDHWFKQFISFLGGKKKGGEKQIDAIAGSK